MQRRHRLTRSQDFDAVYRRGRSVSTRFLVLYVFPREEEETSAEPAAAEPRLGLAVPKRIGTAVARNRIKRRLRELWRSRLEVVAPGCDYILVVRPGLVEAAETRGAAWLGDRLDEVLGKADA
jgi:ribonuclease P protein component